MQHGAGSTSARWRGTAGVLAGTLLATVLTVVSGVHPAAAAPAPITVDSLGDEPDAIRGNGTCATTASTCTLRAAIQEANAGPAGTRPIGFSVAGTIRPTTAFPAATASVGLDGTTAPGYAHATGPRVRITCDDAPTVADGLVISGPGSTVRALEVDGCDHAITLTATADGGKVLGSWVGTDAVRRPSPRNGTRGIGTTADDVQIGGTGPGEGNLVNGEEQAIQAINPSPGGPPVDVTVQGNRVGVRGDGTEAVGSYLGIDIGPGVAALVGGTAPGAGNVVSSANAGVHFTDNGAGITVQGNRLGTDPTGTTADANAVGIRADPSTGPRAGSAIPLIGGSAPGAGNLLSGNSFTGISARGPVVIQGNLIGTDVSGTVALPNGVAWSRDAGIEVGAGFDGVDPEVVIGGSGPGEGNVISGNVDEGISVDASGYRILGNLIGTDITGTQPLPNGRSNIRILGRQAGAGEIGGTGPGEGNTIANASEAGVDASGTTDHPLRGVRIRGNRFTGNTGLSIDLYGHQPVFAANGDQDAPVITSTVPSGGSLTVTGTVTSDRAGPLLVDVYAASTCPSPWNTGEAEELLGTISVPSAGGDTTTAFTGSVDAPRDRDVITATTTQAVNGTSQFSACGPVSDLDVTVTTNRTSAHLGDEVAAELRVTNLGPAPATDVVVPIGGPGSAIEHPVIDVGQGTVSGTTWTVGSLPAGASATVCMSGVVTRTFTTSVDGWGIERTMPSAFSASLGWLPAGRPDPYRGNDFAFQVLNVGQAPPDPHPDPTVCHPAVSVDDAALARPAASTAPMAFDLRLSDPSPAPVAVSYRTVAGTAVPVEDFTATTGTVTIPAGDVTATITVPIVGGQTDEPDKAFTLELTPIDGALIRDGSATGRITANHLLAGCPAGSTASRRFVCHLYADALGRAPDAAGLAYWSGRVAGTTPRPTVARAFLSEPEALRRVADRPYVRYLGRHGTNAELQGWAARYRARTATPEDTRISVLAGATYWAQADGSPTTFVEHLYRDVFRRTPDPSGVAYWAGRLAAGQSRATIARRFVAEPEGRRKVVSDIYLRFLRREATTAEAARLVIEIARGRTEVDVGIGVTASSEYFDR